MHLLLLTNDISQYSYRLSIADGFISTKQNESERIERKKNHSTSERCKSCICDIYLSARAIKNTVRREQKKESATVVDVIKLMIIDFSVEQNWRLWIFIWS